MIKGIGTDIIEIERIANAINRRKETFIKRLFTLNEQQAKPVGTLEHIAAYYAGRFAAKEAVVKALGTGFRGIDWQDIEIVNDELGKPCVRLSQVQVERLKNPILLISISHSKTHAVAFCIWQ